MSAVGDNQPTPGGVVNTFFAHHIKRDVLRPCSALTRRANRARIGSLNDRTFGRGFPPTLY